MLKAFVSLVLVFQVSFVWGQDQQPDQQSNVIEKYGPRRQISTIVYCGLAGAVLGLSTLSFYGRPQDKLTNIPIGFGIGVVVGTIYMTYQAAANPDEFYRDASLEYKPEFINRSEELVMTSDLYYSPPQPQLGYAWKF